MNKSIQCPYFPGFKFHRRMADKYNLNLAWKRPVSRMYEFNRQLGENYYQHLTTYIDQKEIGVYQDPPGALTMRYFECTFQCDASLLEQFRGQFNSFFVNKCHFFIAIQ